MGARVLAKALIQNNNTNTKLRGNQIDDTEATLKLKQNKTKQNNNTNTNTTPWISVGRRQGDRVGVHNFNFFNETITIFMLQHGFYITPGGQDKKGKSTWTGGAGWIGRNGWAGRAGMGRQGRDGQAGQAGRFRFFLSLSLSLSMDDDRV